VISASKTGTSTGSLISGYADLLEDAVLRTAIWRLEEATRVKVAFARSVQSEIVNNVSSEAAPPLVTLLEFSKWIEQRSTENIAADDLHRYMTLIELAATRLLETFDDILTRPGALDDEPPRQQSAA
jgi:hypothetical protein